MTALAGTRLGPYEIVSAIGAGGMGEVYRARDPRLDRDVAIKILPHLFAADAERLARFEREAKALASLNHPHIAQIYGVEEMPMASGAAAPGAGPAGTALVMELVEGEDLSARITRGPMSVAEALPIAQQIADALETAHERGIIHRDLKPANVKVSADGVVKVLDFGLAKALESRDAAADPANSPTMAVTGTRAGLILGTAGYMAPEQARGQVVDRRIDVWALADGTSGRADIWVYAFARGTYTRLTFTGVSASPVWSADSREIFFAATDRAGAGTTVFRTSADGGREATAVASIDNRGYLKHVSADGTWALVDYITFGAARANIGRLPLRQGAKVEPLIDTRADEYAAALSPGGRFVAYQSDEGGRPEIYVRELAASAGRWQISNAGGEEPMWSADGRTLFYRIEGRFMRVPVETGNTFSAGLPSLAFDGIYNLRSDTGVSYQPHPDGTRLLMTRPADVVSSGSVRLITRWFDELRTIK